MARQYLVEVDLAHSEEQVRLTRVEVKSQSLAIHEVDKALEVIFYSEVEFARFRVLTLRLDQDWDNLAFQGCEWVQEEPL